MPKIAIITDTVSTMTKELADEYSIKVLPMWVILDGKACPENQIDLAWYYGQIPQWKASNKMPTTSSISTGQFLEAFRELSQKVEAILYIGYSSKFGMAFSSAVQAKKMAESELPQTVIEVIDTYTVLGAQMLIVIEASKAVAAGKTLSEVVQLVNSLIKKVFYIGLYDDLSLLAKGGRIHKARSWAESRVTNTALLDTGFSTGGETKPLARYRTRPQAREKLFDTVVERSGKGKLHVAINHLGALAEAEELKEITLSRFAGARVFITPVYPLVAGHVGLESIHFSWWGE